MAGDVLRRWALVFLLSPNLSFAQGTPSALAASEAQLTELKKLQGASQWEEILQRVPTSEGSAEECFYRGLALSRLQRWEPAREAFEAGGRKAPTDARFPRELASASVPKPCHGCWKLWTAVPALPASSHTKRSPSSSRSAPTKRPSSSTSPASATTLSSSACRGSRHTTRILCGPSTESPSPLTIAEPIV